MNSAEKQAVLHCLKSMIDEEVCEECPLYGTTGTDHCEKDCVRLAINALSSSENPNKWIPVETALPDKNMRCLVAVGRFNCTQIATYSDLMGTIDHRIFFRGDNEHGNFEDITQYVKAWMPLPKPYQPETPTDSEGSEE